METTVRKHFTVKLSQGEILARAKRASEIRAEIGQAEFDFFGRKKAHLCSKRTLLKEMHSLLTTIGVEAEDREFSCRVIRDFDKQTVSYIDEASGRVMETRGMTEEEIVGGEQKEMDFVVVPKHDEKKDRKCLECGTAIRSIYHRCDDCRTRDVNKFSALAEAHG